MPKRVLMLGTFDSKGPEYAFLRERLLSHGCEVVAVNAGVFGSTDLFPVDIEAGEVARNGGEALMALRDQQDRGKAMEIMSRGAMWLVRDLFDAGKFDAIIGMGGSGGTGIVTTAMKNLPLGVPKLCVSTLASGNTAPYVGTKDIILMPSIADVAGINRISRQVLTQAAAALCGMVHAVVPTPEAEKPLIAASMFGNTTKCVDACRQALTESGYEVLVFHATGTGGRILESLADAEMVDAVLDITTTEWADELCGGVLSAGPERLDAPGRRALPHVIVPGCIDMCNFSGMASVPDRYRDAGRQFYEWTSTVTLMRTTAAENARMGQIFAEKANAAKGPVAFAFPLRGVSMLDADDGLFCDRTADQAFFDAVKAAARPDIPIIEVDANINDPAFAAKCVEVLLELIASQRTEASTQPSPDSV